MGPELNVTESVRFVDQLPSRDELIDSLGFRPEKIIVIVDRSLRGARLKTWLKQFTCVYKVKAGESLKDFARFPAHISAIDRLLGSVSPQSVAVAAVGGGTVGDFAGFFASIYKRGVPFVQVPTTFLAALDSAHGGKTGVNLKGVKNQVGSFHQPRAVWIVAELLRPLPQAQCHAALGELLKMALLAGGELYQSLSQMDEWDFKHLWQLAPAAVKAKYEIVRRDPFESSGERQKLNLGHTLGHALESYYQIPHGEAVALGLDFAIQWSLHRGYLSSEEATQLGRIMHGNLKIPLAAQFLARRKKISARRLADLLSADKKVINARSVQFVFLEKVGQCRRVAVPIESLVTEAQRQGWIGR